MSRAIVTIMNITANPTGLDQSNFISVSKMAKPVIEGFIKRILINRITDMALRTKIPVFIVN